MGACYQSFSVAGTETPQQLKDEFHKVQDADRHSHGHEYSGGFGQCSGLKITNRVFGDVAAAEEWVGDNARKWGDALAVRFKCDEGERWYIGAWCAE